MGDVNSNLHKVISACEGTSQLIKGYSRIYTFATENISGYIDYFDFNNKSLLTVGSSGDQVLNAFYNGARDITLFDINEYAKYYVYLKISAILTLSYEEFKLFFFKYGPSPFENNLCMFSKDLFDKMKDTLRLLDYESYQFFDELFSTCEINKIRGYLFYDDEARIKIITGINNYLKNEESYNKLKVALWEISLKYINGDIFNSSIEGKYDNIFLSNICTTTYLERMKKLLRKLDKHNLNDNGSVLVGYLWNTSFDEDSYDFDFKEVYKMPITRQVLKKYITESHSITGVRDILWEKDEKQDLVLIYRKK